MAAKMQQRSCWPTEYNLSDRTSGQRWKYLNRLGVEQHWRCSWVVDERLIGL